MKSQTRLVILALAACGYASGAFALDFKNVGASPVIMYDAPSIRGQKLFIAPRGMPVEVVINYGAWSKVRDFAGDLSWIETKQLSERKNILVRNLNAKIRITADDYSEVVFSADKGVVLELVDTVIPGWAKVKHSDGATGYVRLNDVWGI
ncbi:SH3 domain-containing protein [Solimicrobium silvestre]|uniref:Bacterial SH3 domain n=1 Tax=Solimicrobium silvestre TaxID=2099400 RepID=A0A2S9H3E0_9BURK|nr:SH3 domain-containing protein [Solimicrobium silvestre]PRC94453.1 Bacterial SH3 domain [Solimicrobium silvestre]